jgi:hypothetical protein
MRGIVELCTLLWRRAGLALCLTAGLLAAGCNNNPYPLGSERENTLFYSFDERSPRCLDPTASYANPESAYTMQAYDPPSGYHYLKRPYQLEPKSAAAVAKPRATGSASTRSSRA